MTANALPTNMAPQSELTDPERAARQAPQDQPGALDWEVPQSQREPLAKPAAPGRMPLFRR